jgi:cupin 2 domain-containing protein
MVMPPSKNVFDGIPAQLPNELIETLLSSTHLRVERIVSSGHASPSDFWYDQSQHEWVLLVEGAARLEFENGFVDLTRGDFVNIPAHTKHRVESTDPTVTTIWLAIHYGGPIS